MPRAVLSDLPRVCPVCGHRGWAHEHLCTVGEAVLRSQRQTSARAAAIQSEHAAVIERTRSACSRRVDEAWSEHRRRVVRIYEQAAGEAATPTGAEVVS